MSEMAVVQRISCPVRPKVNRLLYTAKLGNISGQSCCCIDANCTFQIHDCCDPHGLDRFYVFFRSCAQFAWAQWSYLVQFSGLSWWRHVTAHRERSWCHETLRMHSRSVICGEKCFLNHIFRQSHQTFKAVFISFDWWFSTFSFHIPVAIKSYVISLTRFIQIKAWSCLPK